MEKQQVETTEAVRADYQAPQLEQSSVSASYESWGANPSFFYATMEQ